MDSLPKLLELFISFHFLVSSLIILTCSLSSMHQPCHQDECSALFQFKESFVIDTSASSDPSAYPKFASWKPQGKRCECCSWDGVECDEDTGHVITLDLTRSCLSGSLYSNSTLFRLLHLQWLSLADNDFKHSKIPSEFGNLSRLSHLDLSFSAFSGQIPQEILQLSRLVSLDLSRNLLRLQKPGFRSLVEKLRHLQVLHLSEVNISSTVPQVLANLSSLTSLLLRDCGLHGEFPMTIFQLANLQSLSLSFNPNLTGYMPVFLSSSPLEVLKLSGTSFSGILPYSIGCLKSLNVLEIDDSNFSGPIPSSLGNLTKLTSLDLSYNKFSGEIPSFLANFTQLTFLDLGDNNFNPGTLFWLGKLQKPTKLYLKNVNLHGDIPFSLCNLTQLIRLSINFNQLTGEIPSCLGNLTQLTVLRLEHNKLHGQIPQSISRLLDLRFLYLDNNYLIGQLNFDLFFSLKNLIHLQLSSNSLSLIAKPNFNFSATGQKFKLLGLGVCNLLKFPDFLKNQDKLEVLFLHDNKIHGQVPNWMLNVSKESLSLLTLGSNFLTGFESSQSPIILPWTNLCLLELPNNNLQSLPIPPSSIIYYDVSNNNLTGEISSSICNLTSIQMLDLSNNSLGGMLPKCLGDLNNSPLVLHLQNNKFHGEIPETFKEGCQLKRVDFSQNQLQRKVPRSLVNCTLLEYFDLGSNHINDTFPYWLGSLPMLKVLILRSNEFHGAREEPKTTSEFPMLRIVDLSNNGFTGELPSQYFRLWNAMKLFDAHHLQYLKANIIFQIPNYSWNFLGRYDMTITNKGMEMYYERIQDFLVAIDLSSNRFEGAIPEVIGSLKALRLLNLSNNILSGHIPSSLGSLSELESLDLSHNKLSGGIPRQLVQVTSLAKLDVSYNNLSGLIPHGKQFDTFQNDSYRGNSGLCGKPLSRECENSDTSPSPEKDEGSYFIFDFGWEVVVIGYASGLIVGLAIGYFFTERKNGWFNNTFGMRSVKRSHRRR